MRQGVAAKLKPITRNSQRKIKENKRKKERKKERRLVGFPSHRGVSNWLAG